jgi:hypothetical protein
MIENKIQDNIDTINSKLNKQIAVGYGKSQKIRKSIQKHIDKIIEDSQRLIDETDPQLTEEGVQKITKKGKIYFRSLRAFNPFVHFLNDQATKLKMPDEDEQLTSTELNQFVRNLSRMYNDVNKEKVGVDKIMGLDFLRKKRGMYGSLSKINSELGNLRDLQKEEYSIIKALEDLHSLQRDVENITQTIENLNEELENLKSQLKATEDNLDKKEKLKQQFLENPLVSDSRQRGIRLTELEIELGRHLNSQRKVFKKYAREVQRGSVSGEFGLVNAALAYEKDPVQRFLKEEEGNPEILALIDELTDIGESSLHIKQKNINNLRQLSKRIKEGNLDKKKSEWTDLRIKKEEDESSVEFKKKIDELNTCENEIKQINSRLSELNENIGLREREISNLSDSLIERKERSATITSETLKWK